jgi:hypothetical protein
MKDEMLGRKYCPYQYCPYQSRDNQRLFGRDYLRKPNPFKEDLDQMYRDVLEEGHKLWEDLVKSREQHTNTEDHPVS